MSSEMANPARLVITPTEAIGFFLSKASNDPHLSHQLRQSADDLFWVSNVPYAPLRAIWMASDPSTRPHLIWLFSGTHFVFNSPKPREKAVLEKFHPPRPDWYEEFYASVLNSAMESYEAEVSRYKSQVFSNLRGKAQKVLEIGIGTGPNLKYYASDSDAQVIGIDPNQKMEKYARSSAESAGLPLSNFEFIHAVGEVIPLHDASVDAVVGTLVLCSVKNVNMTLKEVKRVLRPGGLYVFVEHVAAKDGTFLRFVQSVLDPLQQTLADRCHLSRETGNSISNAGFSSVELNTAFVSRAAYTNPHVYGIACK